MPSTRYISKLSARQLLLIVVLLALLAVFVLAIPAAKAFAASNESTTLGILVTDSSASGGQGQGSSGTGTTTLGIRVTDSKNLAVGGYTLTLSKNDGSDNNISIEATFNLPLTKVEPPARVGYTFLGYFDDPMSGTQYYKANGTYARVWDKASDATLYAHWEAHKYMVSFSQGGGMGGQTDLVEVTFGSAMPTITSLPSKTGYTFAGYFDTAGKQYYGSDGKSKSTWDKDANDVILTAHWTLQITCSFPDNALIQVDASGKITGQNGLTFSSSSVEAVKITAVKSTQDVNAPTLFVTDATIKGVRILLKPTSGSGSEVQVPLTTKGTTIPNGGWTIAAAKSSTPTKLSVSFGLSLPKGAQLNYLAGDGTASIANLSYVVSAASAS